MISSVGGENSMKQIGQSPVISLRLEDGVSLSFLLWLDVLGSEEVVGGRGAWSKMRWSSEVRNASWYCRCSGALRTLCRT